MGDRRTPAASFTFRDVAHDIFALLDHLGIDRVKAIGMSAGANTLLHMATQQPARVAAMIHVSGTPRFPDQARAMMTRRCRRRAWDASRITSPPTTTT